MKRDLLSIRDLSKEEIFRLFNLAEELKIKTQRGEREELLKGKTLGMIFTKSSTRTRISFEVGVYQLGGYPLFLNASDLQLGRGETIEDTAKVLSRYLDMIMIRTFKHDDVVKLAEYASIPVINGLTDLLHPCQVLGDLFTIYEKRKSFHELKVTYVGDGNNLANSWLNAASIIPFTLHLAVPEGYEPDEKIFENAKKSGISDVKIFRDPLQAASNADVVYTDVWVSMGQEKETEKRMKDFRGFQLNRELINCAKPDVMVMHCLPAHRGLEITDEVMDGSNSVIMDEAENRLHIQKAIMVTLFKHT